jgi:hypothetical protein
MKKKPKPVKLDLYAEHRDEYITPKSPAFVTVARAYYLGIEGQGAPGSEAFAEAVGALYAVAFTVKMARKAAGVDYAVAKLESLWWVGPHPAGADFLTTPRDAWHWKLLIRTPDFIKKSDVSAAVKELLTKGKPAAVKRVERFALVEGRCVQMLHVGAYSDEPASIARMVAFTRENGVRLRGTHHEIYLSDPRRIAAAKLRTILRIPVGRLN